MRSIVLADDFLDGNYLSTELRVPVTLLQTNACSPLATNALEDNIWDNFSSQSYKHLPSVGTIKIYDPFTGEASDYTMPANGRGYTRPPSLISLWSTAPFLLNNSVGDFNPSPAVDARMASFQSGIEQMLWPEKRRKDPVLGDKIPGVIDRTTETSYLSVPAGYLPDGLSPMTSWLYRWFPAVFTSRGDVKIGPIPKGTPVDLLANLSILRDKQDLEGHADQIGKILDLLLKLQLDLAQVDPKAGDDKAREILANLAKPMLALSKCPDFVVNRGHYFGTDHFAEEPALSDQEKRDLIEFLKTF